MASTVGGVVSRIKAWTTSESLDNEEVWALMNEVIDEIVSTTSPWFCWGYGKTSRTASNHMNDSSLIPPAYAGGVLAVDADIVSGTTVPDNSEYLRALLYPDGLVRASQVYYGDLADNIELKNISLQELNERYPFTTSGPSGENAEHWTSYNGTILIGPTPSLACSLSVFGLYKPTVTSNGDTNVFVENAESLLRYGVMNKLVIYDYEEDSNRGPNIERTYNRLLRTLKLRSKYQDSKAHRARSTRAGTRRT